MREHYNWLYNSFLLWQLGYHTLFGVRPYDFVPLPFDRFTIIEHKTSNLPYMVVYTFLYTLLHIFLIVNIIFDILLQFLHFYL